MDVDGVIKVWSFNPIMQTKASSISKSPLLSLEWATKRDRLVSSLCVEVQQIWGRVACSLLDSCTGDKIGQQLISTFRGTQGTSRV